MYKGLKLSYIFSQSMGTIFSILFGGYVYGYKKKCDNNWEYCVYLGQDENGKKKYKRKSGFKTKKACIKEASHLKNKNQ